MTITFASAPLKLKITVDNERDKKYPIRHLWLDLEDTIIFPVTEGWNNTHIIPENLKKIQDFIMYFGPDYLHIFSFAVWNDWEKQRFNDSTRAMIEKALGLRFMTVPTVDEIISVCKKAKNIQSEITFQELLDFWGKHEAFRLYIQHLFKAGNTAADVALLDDAVFNEIFEWRDLQIKGMILNIDTLEIE